MLKRVLILTLLATPAVATNKPSHFGCTFANGQTLEGWAKDGDIMLDFDNNGNWQKAFGRIENNMAIITEIVSGGMFTLAWNLNNHEAYAVTHHNSSGRKVENHAFCSWR
jgi:hypothetical protein